MTLHLPEVIVYGTVCLDRFAFVDDEGHPLPERAAPDTADGLHEMPGGEAFNTATMLAGWGVRVALTGTAIGADAEGERLRTLLDTSPLSLSRDLIPDDPHAVTPVCTVRVFPDGERRMNGRGFAQAVAPPPLPFALLTNRPLFVTDPNLGEPARKAAAAAHEAGCSILAMDWAKEPFVIARSRILVTSREMLSKQFGQDVAADVEGMTHRLCTEGGAKTAIVTLGADGCIVADRDEGMFTQSAFPLPNILDTTGAGDAFRAGLAWGLLHDLPTRETVRFASAAGALHSTVLGGGSRIPLNQVQALTALSDRPRA